MADSSASNDPGAIHWLAEAWGDSFASVLETMAGERPAVQVVDTTPSLQPAGLDTTWWKQLFDVAEGAEMWVGVLESHRTDVGLRALRAAEMEEAEPDELVDTFQELLRQALSSTAQRIGARVGTEVTCQDGEPASAPQSETVMLVEVRFANAEPSHHCLAFSPQLIAGLQPEPAPVESVAAGSEPHVAEASPSRTGDRTRSSSKTIDLLLDVELPVSISFGRAYLPLRDVLKLTSGSIVELNRSVAQPVEVIVNNCVIARGEVVVVEGNYGVRVNQIISRQERLRTLD